jgi:hypothetical protein
MYCPRHWRDRKRFCWEYSQVLVPTRRADFSKTLVARQVLSRTPDTRGYIQEVSSSRSNKTSRLFKNSGSSSSSVSYSRYPRLHTRSLAKIITRSVVVFLVGQRKHEDDVMDDMVESCTRVLIHAGVDHGGILHPCPDPRGGRPRAHSTELIIICLIVFS